MKLKTKIVILTILFAARATIYFFDGIIAFANSASYGDYGNAFVNAGIMAYIAYSIYITRKKWTYWIAIIFVSIVLLRFMLAIVFLAFSEVSISIGPILLTILNAVIFGIVPFLFLNQKDMRNYFLS